MSAEVWKPVRGYKGFYAVSDLGRVRSLARRVPSKGQFRKVSPRILKLHVGTDGYWIAKLNRRGLQRTISVHRLVATAFLGPIKKGLIVNHIDGDKLNARLSNLEVITYAENNLHAYAAGLKKPVRRFGEESFVAKLTPRLVLQIRALASSGASQRGIAAVIGVGKSTVARVLRRESWSHIK